MYKTIVAQGNSDDRKVSKITRSLFFIFIVFFPLVGLITWVLLSSATRNSQVSSGEQAEVVEVTQLEYFVAQTRFKSLSNNLKLADLREEEIAAFPKDKEKIEKMLDVSEVYVIDKKDIYDWQEEEEFGGIVIVPVENADFRLKSLAVEDINIWEADDLSEYALVWEETVRIDQSQRTDHEVTNFSSSNLITYVVGGEVIPARAVARKFRRTKDYTFPFHEVKTLFNEADVSSIILENTIGGSPEPCYGCVWFAGDEAFIEGLQYLGVDFISPGNHMGDGGRGAMGRTIEVLDEAGILHSGFSTLNLEEASEPAIYEVDGFKIAFLGYDDVAYYHWAGSTWGGVATISQRFEDGSKVLLEDKIKSDVVKGSNLADYVVVQMSWGDQEYVNWALDYQKEMGHALVDAGADLIVGSHQHWVGEIEFYKGKPIFYGLGNFVFDQTHTDPTRQGVILKFCFFQKKLVSVKIIPHETCGPQQSAVDDENCNHFQPQILEESDPAYKEIMERMFEYSDV